MATGIQSALREYVPCLGNHWAVAALLWQRMLGSATSALLPLAASAFVMGNGRVGILPSYVASPSATLW